MAVYVISFKHDLFISDGDCSLCYEDKGLQQTWQKAIEIVVKHNILRTVDMWLRTWLPSGESSRNKEATDRATSSLAGRGLYGQRKDGN